MYLYIIKGNTVLERLKYLLQSLESLKYQTFKNQVRTFMM